MHMQVMRGIVWVQQPSLIVAESLHSVNLSFFDLCLDVQWPPFSDLPRVQSSSLLAATPCDRMLIHCLESLKRDAGHKCCSVRKLNRN